MARKVNKSMQIRKYALKHPKASYTQVADACGVTVKYVYQILYKVRKTAGVPATKKAANALPVRGKGDEYEQRDGVWQPPALSPVPPAPDMVNHPPHYKVGGIETIDFIEAKQLNYNLGNVVKYITRADHKGERTENLQKALWYLNRELSHA